MGKLRNTIVIFLFLQVLTSMIGLWGQSADAPERDCINAIPVCRRAYTQPNSYVGIGNGPTEINNTLSCLGAGEKNGVWYIFTVSRTGRLIFEITPRRLSDDYDWGVYNLTRNRCSDIARIRSLEVSCNFSGAPGVTGLIDSGNLPGTQWERAFTVNQGETYVVYVSNYSSSQSGYTIDFSKSTADIADTQPPVFSSISTPVACGATTLTVNFNENLLCSSVQSTDFRIKDPTGQIYIVTAARGNNCTSDPKSYDRTFTLSLNQPITTAGNWTFELVSQVTDICENVAPQGAWPFTVTNFLEVNQLEIRQISCPGATDGMVRVAPIGGMSPFTYRWTNAANTVISTLDSASTLAAGTYTVTISDARGCIGTRSFTITSNNNLTLRLTPSPVSCPGGSNGRITLTIPPGLQATYEWRRNGNVVSTAQNPTGLPAGRYTVRVVTATGCTASDSTTINENPSDLSVTLGQLRPVSCIGLNDGSITIQVSGGRTPYNFEWEFLGLPLANTQNISNLLPGTYTVTVTESGGCTRTLVATVTQPLTELTVSMRSVVNAGCNDARTGAININVTGGNTPYTFAWSGGAGSQQNATNLSSGTYTVTVTDATRCTRTLSATVTQPTPVTLAPLQVTPVACNGGRTGSIQVSTTSGAFPFNYRWSNDVTTKDLVNIPAATYTVTVTAANGCTASATASLTQPTALRVQTGEITHPRCHNAQTGRASLTPSGGTPPYSYLWNNNTTTQNLTNAQAGQYVVTVTDAQRCTSTTTLTITQPTPIEIRTTRLRLPSCDDNTGTAEIVVSASGGTASTAPPPTTTVRDTIVYSENFETNRTINSLTANGWECNDCTSGQDQNYWIVNNDYQGGSVQVANIATVPNQTATITGAARSHYLHVTFGGNRLLGFFDFNFFNANYLSTARGRECITTPVIDARNLEDVRFGYYWLANPGTNVASIEISVNNGTYQPLTPPRPLRGQQTWIGDTIRDNRMNNATFRLRFCFDNNTGTPAGQNDFPFALDNLLVRGIRRTTSGGGGGTTGYTYAWSNGVNGAVNANLNPGIYTVTVTDQNQCTRTLTVELPRSSGAIDVDVVTIIPESCGRMRDGQVNINASGGVPPYTYLWSNNLTTQNALALSSGTYTVTVSDANGCTQTVSGTVPRGPALGLSSIQTQPRCGGAANGLLAVTHARGQAPFSYLWSNGRNSRIINGITAGIYTVTVTDFRGCRDSLTITLNDATTLALRVTRTQPTCPDTRAGAITVTVSGGAPPYTYKWSNGATTPSLQNLMGGVYVLTVTDAQGCIIQRQDTIRTIIPLTFSAQITPTACQTAENGRLTVNVSGGTAPYTYQWQNSSGLLPQTTNHLQDIPTGIYTVTVTDANRCTRTYTANVIALNGFTITPKVLAQPTCREANGRATVEITGGMAPFTIAWSNRRLTQVIDSLAEGTYFVTVSDANGCLADGRVQLKAQSALTITASRIINESCPGSANGEIHLSVSGGLEPYTYTWTNGKTTPVVTGLEAGEYEVDVADALRCLGRAKFMVAFAVPMTLTLNSTPSSACDGSSNAIITTNITGGTEPYTFLWSDNASTRNRIGVAAGIYTVTVTDNSRCTVTASTAVQPGEPFRVTLSATNISIPNGINGTIRVEATGGTPPYVYTVNTLLTNNTGFFNNLTHGLYRVNVVDAGGCEFNDTIRIYPYVEPPCTSPGVSFVRAITESSAIVNWDPAPSAVAYIIQYRPVNRALWSEIVAIDPNITLLDLMPNTQYVARVRSICPDNRQSVFNPQVFFTTPAGSACSAPRNLRTSNLTNTSMQVSWDRVPIATGYILQYRSLTSPLWFETTVTQTTFALLNLLQGTTYSLRVRAVCGVNTQSVFSDEVQATTLGKAVNCDRPTLNQITNITTTGATVAWNSVRGALSYNLEYRIANSSASWTAITTPNVVFNLTNLNAGTLYEVRVRANCEGNVFSDFLQTTFRTSGLNNTCLVPTGISRSALQPTATTYQWNAVPGAVSYEVSIRAANENTFRTPVNTPTNSITFSDLVPSTAYQLRVRTRCAGGIFSEWSLIFRFTTPAARAMTEPLAVNSAQMSVYPNPNQGNFMIRLDSPASTTATVEVFDMLGNLVYTKTTPTMIGEQVIPVTLNDTAKGMFIVRLSAFGQVLTRRITVQ